MVQIDGYGLEWTTATGEQGVIDQSRNEPTDKRWSELINGAKAGYEVIAICTFNGCNSSSHMALKMWGPNHSGSCGYQESGDCCCWYDLGIRYNGDVQTQIEREHPNNHTWTCTECTMSNIGMVMDGNTIGLRWLIYPLVPNGSAANGGIRFLMWVSTNALLAGVPRNNWVLVMDVIDNATRDILDTSDWALSGRPSYNAPSDHDIEMRVSDTDTVDTYGGGLHYRLMRPSDVYGGGSGGGGGGTTACPAGQCKDPVTTQCRAIAQGEFVDSNGFCVYSGPPPASNTDIRLFLSGGTTNTDVKKSLGGNVSSQEVLGTESHQFMERVSSQELSAGLTDYHLVYIKNVNQIRSYNNIRIFFYHNTINPFDTLLIGLAAAGKGNEEMPLAFDVDVPPNVTFTASQDNMQGLYIPTLAPNQYYGMWIKRAVNSGSPVHHANVAKIAIDFTPSEIPSEPNVPPPEEPCPEGTHRDPDTQQCVPDDPNIPPPTDIVNFVMAVIGDMNCSSHFTNNWRRLTARNPVKILTTGDLGADCGQDCWIPIVNSWRDKFIITFGNHDYSIECQPETRNATYEFARLSTSYYSITFNNVGVLVMNANIDNESGTVASELETLLQQLSNNPAVEWIFVTHHFPMYGSESNHSNDETTRNFWHPKFDQYKVDAVFNGHNHNKQASKLIRYNSSNSDNPIVTQSGGTYSYNRATPNHGVLFWQDGTGGQSRYSISGQASYVDWQMDDIYGYTMIEFSDNGHKATFRSYDENDNLLYTASITHRI